MARMKLIHRITFMLLAAVYALATLYAGHQLYMYWVVQSIGQQPPNDGPRGVGNRPVIKPAAVNLPVVDPPSITPHRTATSPAVHIVSTTGAGDYLWRHILGAETNALTLSGVRFLYHHGYGQVPGAVSMPNGDVIVVLNARDDDKISVSQLWLASLVQNPNIRNLILIILGKENCENSWITSYRHDNRNLRAVFLVYDDRAAGHVIFHQWPLGVATYRGFPSNEIADSALRTNRKYSCNFLGTVYGNSSRERLMASLGEHGARCYVKVRYQWLPKERPDSMSEYVDVLRNSDLTLCPIGRNPECYRIYEALALGSVPVVENRSGIGQCGNQSEAQYPLRLLKSYGAPFIYVDDWGQLADILSREDRMSPDDKVVRRLNVVSWYRGFRRKMADKLVGVLLNSFH